MPPLLSEEEIDNMDSGDESDDEPISTKMLEDNRDRSQFHLSIIRENHVINYVIILSKDNQNGKER